MSGIKGLTKGVERARRLPIIGKLRKGAARTEEDVAKKRPGKELEWFRFTSDEPGLEELFAAIFGADPAIITGVLPMATVDECFPNRCEGRDKAGFLEHACDGETCSIWRDDKGGYHYAAPGEQGPPCPGGCKAIGRLYLEIPELQRAGYSGWIVAETKAKNDIPAIYDALSIIAEKRRGSLLGLRGVPIVLRRVSTMIPTPRPDGSKRRQEKWLVQLLESPEWAARQAELARADREPAVNPRQKPDWEDVTSHGRPVAEIEHDEFLAGDPDAENGGDQERPAPPSSAPPAPAPAPGNGNSNGAVSEERKALAKTFGAKVVAAARAAGYSQDASKLLQAMGYTGALQLLAAAEQDGENAVLNQMLDVVFPWPAELLNTALATLPYYRARQHVVNALNRSGLPRTRDQGELLDWLASHARERAANPALASAPVEPWDEEVAL